jgi:hypothetical protein
MSSASKSRSSSQMSKLSSICGCAARKRGSLGSSQCVAKRAPSDSRSRVSPRASWRARPAVAREEDEAQLLLHLLDLVADGRRGQPQLVGRTREVQVAACGLEAAQRARARWKLAHGSSNFS